MTTQLTRRDLLESSAAGAVALPLLGSGVAAATPNTPQPASENAAAISLLVNGKQYTLNLEARVSLLDALREHLALTGTKKGCDHGSCGSCTVHIDGKRVLACLTLAARLEGKPITTIEGLEQNGALHPMQAAFVEHDGYQCGYCTPGQIMSAVSVVTEGHTSSPAEIAEWMSGNICRCGAYTNIRDAIADVARRQRA